MLVLLSPAKTLDLETPVPTGLRCTQPRLLDDTQAIVDVMETKSPADLARLMHISDSLAELNAQRYAEFSLPFTRRNARPALFTFAGDVYVGLDAASFDRRDLTEAGKTVRMLSGLYGLLRPRDLIQPYRLEMGTALATSRGKDLYEFWGSTLTDLVATDAEASPGATAVVNLASNEYSTAVDLAGLDLPVVSPRFEDRNPKGSWAVISFYAKRARGLMAAWMVHRRVRRLGQLKQFDVDGYRYAPDVSTPDVPVFRRER